ncbi:MAG: carbohydrate-binding module family 20 domain-containing protein [Candidatus Krumholzibacteriota bacterium]
MKKLLTLTVCVMLLGVAGNAFALIDWAGNVWPNHGQNVTPTGPVDVYAQVYKNGITDPGGQGADISAVLYYTTDIAAQANAPMTYLGDVGANDEYTAQVPQAALVGAAWVDVTVIFSDATDGTDFEVAADQAGNVPPFRYNVIDVLPNDIIVRFTLCMSGTATTPVPCVIGSAAEIGSWGTGVNMIGSPGDPELFTVDVVFAAGGNPSFEYKYKKDACATWEGTANRLVTLPTDGTTLVELAPDSWEFAPITCGLGNTLEEDKVICFQVCLDGVDNTGGVCTVGGIPELDNWGAGIPADLIGAGLYQTCVVFEAGRPIPLTIEYKFKKDDCNTWEGGANKVIVLDNTLAPETTVTHVWEDGPGVCAPVAVEEAAWGTIKGMYR